MVLKELKVIDSIFFSFFPVFCAMCKAMIKSCIAHFLHSIWYQKTACRAYKICFPLKDILRLRVPAFYIPHIFVVVVLPIFLNQTSSVLSVILQFCSFLLVQPFETEFSDLFIILWLIFNLISITCYINLTFYFDSRPTLMFFHVGTFHILVFFREALPKKEKLHRKHLWKSV